MISSTCIRKSIDSGNEGTEIEALESWLLCIFIHEGIPIIIIIEWDCDAALARNNFNASIWRWSWTCIVFERNPRSCLASFSRYFWACVCVCRIVRVLTMLAIAFHGPFGYFWMAFRNRSCSSMDHVPWPSLLLGLIVDVVLLFVLQLLLVGEWNGWAIIVLNVIRFVAWIVIESVRGNKAKRFTQVENWRMHTCPKWV